MLGDGVQVKSVDAKVKSNDATIMTSNDATIIKSSDATKTTSRDQSQQPTKQTIPPTTPSSSPLDVTPSSHSHLARLPAPPRLRPLSRLPVESLPRSQPRTHEGCRAAQSRDQNPPEIGTPPPPLPFSTVPSYWTGSPRYPTNSTSARRPPFSP